MEHSDKSVSELLESLDTFTESYIETLFWSTGEVEIDEQGTLAVLDDHYGPEDLEIEGLREIISDCQDFQESYGHLFEGREAEAGYDFCLTRNRHGAGFWDGGWPEHGDELTKASKPYGTQGLMPTCDGSVHVHG